MLFKCIIPIGFEVQTLPGQSRALNSQADANLLVAYSLEEQNISIQHIMLFWNKVGLGTEFDEGTRPYFEKITFEKLQTLEPSCTYQTQLSGNPFIVFDPKIMQGFSYRVDEIDENKRLELVWKLLNFLLSADQCMGAMRPTLIQLKGFRQPILNDMTRVMMGINKSSGESVVTGVAAFIEQLTVATQSIALGSESIVNNMYSVATEFQRDWQNADSPNGAKVWPSLFPELNKFLQAKKTLANSAVTSELSATAVVPAPASSVGVSPSAGSSSSTVTRISTSTLTSGAAITPATSASAVASTPSILKKLGVSMSSPWSSSSDAKEKAMQLPSAANLLERALKILAWYSLHPTEKQYPQNKLLLQFFVVLVLNNQGDWKKAFEAWMRAWCVNDSGKLQRTWLLGDIKDEKFNKWYDEIGSARSHNKPMQVINIDPYLFLREPQSSPNTMNFVQIYREEVLKTVQGDLGECQTCNKTGYRIEAKPDSCLFCVCKYGLEKILIRSGAQLLLSSFNCLQEALNILDQYSKMPEFSLKKVETEQLFLRFFIAYVIYYRGFWILALIDWKASSMQIGDNKLTPIESYLRSPVIDSALKQWVLKWERQSFLELATKIDISLYHPTIDMTTRFGLIYETQVRKPAAIQLMRCEQCNKTGVIRGTPAGEFVPCVCNWGIKELLTREWSTGQKSIVSLTTPPLAGSVPSLTSSAVDAVSYHPSVTLRVPRSRNSSPSVLGINPAARLSLNQRNSMNLEQLNKLLRGETSSPQNNPGLINSDLGSRSVTPHSAQKSSAVANFRPISLPEPIAPRSSNTSPVLTPAATRASAAGTPPTVVSPSMTADTTTSQPLAQAGTPPRSISPGSQAKTWLEVYGGDNFLDECDNDRVTSAALANLSSLYTQIEHEYFPFLGELFPLYVDLASLKYGTINVANLLLSYSEHWIVILLCGLICGELTQQTLPPDFILLLKVLLLECLVSVSKKYFEVLLQLEVPYKSLKQGKSIFEFYLIKNYLLPEKKQLLVRVNSLFSTMDRDITMQALPDIFSSLIVSQDNFLWEAIFTALSTKSGINEKILSPVMQEFISIFQQKVTAMT